MNHHHRFRICTTLRRFLPVFLLTYFLLLVVLLLKVPSDLAPSIQNPPSFLSYTPLEKPPLLNHNHNHLGTVENRFKQLKEGLSRNVSAGYVNISFFSHNTTTEFSRRDELVFQEPLPLPSPMVKKNISSGSFYGLNENIFIYSAYYDDRKNDTYIRLLTLARDTASRTLIFCHFQDEIYKVKRTALRYELCENHNKPFGGYVYSCEVPEFVNTVMSYKVTVSFGDSVEKVVIPVRTIRPSKDKLKFVDSYIGESSVIRPVALLPNNDNNNNNNNNNIIVNLSHNNKDVNLKNIENKNNYKSQNYIGRSSNVWNIKNTNHDRRWPYSTSFAVCVPPLFGKISPYRLVEFIELTFLLGAEHIFFYNYDIPDDVRKVLLHYVTKGVITLTPWSLPSNVTSDKIWYNGQLLAHNDCLYRSMPRFDLVAFNDIDEFIVPHDNKSTTWSRVFPELVTNSTCGLSFQSAFFNPGVKDVRSTKLLIPKLVSKTTQFSKVRSKVMLVPWRVFEVGIHHISKQNKENWTVRRVEPSTSFLHHYRRCVDTYDLSCGVMERDDTVNKRYYRPLKMNYEKAVSDIFSK